MKKCKIKAIPVDLGTFMHILAYSGILARFSLVILEI